MSPIRMAACGIIITFAFVDLWNAVMYPLMGYSLNAISRNSVGLALDVTILATLYREECKIYWEILTRRPGK